MRFKSRLHKTKLHYLTASISISRAIDSRAAIFLDNEYMRWSLLNTALENKPQTFIELQKDEIFEEYRIESKSNNQILFEIDLNLLDVALRSGKMSHQVDLKLVKRDTIACLCVEIHNIGNIINHDIPIKVCRADSIHLMAPPQIPSPTVALELPKYGKNLKILADKMSKLSKEITIIGEQNGRLTFNILDGSKSSTISTFFTKVEPRFDTANLNESTDYNNKASVRVELKKLSSVLSYHNVQGYIESACVYMVEKNHPLVVHLELQDEAGVITYYIPPLVNLEEDSD